MKRSVVVDVAVAVMFHSIMVLSVYFLFAGHNQPGGGFVGGLVAGAAIALRYVADGVDAVRSIFRLSPWSLLGVGVFASATTSLLPVLLGGSILEHSDVSFDLPVLGAIKATSALPFDVGVYLVVIGVVLMAFEAFGDDVGAAPDTALNTGPERDHGSEVVG